MLEILILSPEILYYEALPLGLEIKWDKTMIQGSVFNTANPASVSVLGNPLELVKSLTYLGCRIDHANKYITPHFLKKRGVVVLRAGLGEDTKG